MESTSQRHSYQPLHPEQKEIRLLTVHAGIDGSQLQCSLQHVSLLAENRAKYETISYAWGDPTNRAHVMIDNNIHECPGSAHAALCCLRFAEKKRVLWIDSVCINQKDYAERSQQIAMMSDIYSLSERNLAYMGEADEFTEGALSSISKLVDEAYRKTNQFDNLWNYNMDAEQSLVGLEADIDQTALIRLFENPWFQ